VVYGGATDCLIERKVCDVICNDRFRWLGVADEVKVRCVSAAEFTFVGTVASALFSVVTVSLHS
jgi:hypothetical protein